MPGRRQRGAAVALTIVAMWGAGCGRLGYQNGAAPNAPGAPDAARRDAPGDAETDPDGGMRRSFDVLDDFNRPDGVVGSNWTASVDAFSIEDERLLIPGQRRSLIWTTPFGPDQGAEIRVVRDGPWWDMSVVAKLRDPSAPDGSHVRVGFAESPEEFAAYVYYSDDGALVYVGKYVFPAALNEGDRIGLAVSRGGELEVLLNGTVATRFDVTPWPDYAQGGYIGVRGSAESVDVDLDDFAGGDF